MTISDKEIIKEVVEGTSSKENAQNVVDWFATTIEGQQTLSDMIDHDSYMMEEHLHEYNTISPTQSKDLFDKIDSTISNNLYRRVLWHVAAVLIPFVIVFGLGVYINNHFDLIGKTTYTELYIPNGEKAHIIFQDGSEAIINSSSKIKFPKKFGLQKREIELEGEAYFNISHNKYRPFVVKTDQSDITVLGTSFNVSSYSDDDIINVTLDEGIVEFSTSNNKHRLSPGQQLSFNKSNSEYSVRILKNSENNSLWTSDILYFNDTPMLQVLKVLERKFDTKFDINEKQVLDYSFTLTTNMKSIQSILSEIEMIAPVRFSLHNKTYKVSIF